MKNIFDCHCELRLESPTITKRSFANAGATIKRENKVMKSCCFSLTSLLYICLLRFLALSWLLTEKYMNANSARNNILNMMIESNSIKTIRVSSILIYG